MKTTKKWVALLVAMTMIMAVLAGCGNTSNDKNSGVSSQSKEEVKSTEKESSTETKSSEVVELEPVTLTQWVLGSETEDTAMVEDAINEYLKDVLPNTTVDLVFVPAAEWPDRWSKAAAARETIDLSWFGYRNTLSTEISMGSIQSIDELLKEYGSGIIETLGEDFVEAHRSSDGDLYFVPAWQGTVNGKFALYLPKENVDLMGEEWLEETRAALLETSHKPTWDESWENAFSYLEEYMETSKEAGKFRQGWLASGNSLPFGTWNNDQVNSDFLGACYVYYDMDAETYYVVPRYSRLHPLYNEVKLHNEWYHKGYIREDILTGDAGTTKWKSDVPSEQEYISFVHNGWTDSDYVDYANNAGEEIVQLNLQAYGYKSDGFDTGACIPATAENPERAMMLLNLIYTDVDLYHLYVYGIEGTHYTKNADGTITYSDPKTYTGPANWTLGTSLNSLQTDPQKLTYYQDLVEVEEELVTRYFDGFSYDKTSVEIESSYVTAVNKEYGNLTFITLSPDELEARWDEFAKKLKDAQFDKLVENLMSQLTPWAESLGRKVELKVE